MNKRIIRTSQHPRLMSTNIWCRKLISVYIVLILCKRNLIYRIEMIFEYNIRSVFLVFIIQLPKWIKLVYLYSSIHMCCSHQWRRNISIILRIRFQFKFWKFQASYSLSVVVGIIIFKVLVVIVFWGRLLIVRRFFAAKSYLWILRGYFKIWSVWVHYNKNCAKYK